MKEAKYIVTGLVEANKALTKIILYTHNLISQKHTLENDHAGSGKLTTLIGYFSAFELWPHPHHHWHDSRNYWSGHCQTNRTGSASPESIKCHGI